MVARVRLAIGSRRSHSFLLERRNWMQVIVNKAAHLGLWPG
jgi:hypothetical protein